MSTGTVDSTVEGFVPGWVRQYLRDHAIHVVVVVLLVAYPFLYDVLVGMFALTAETLLPRPRTMVMVLVLGLFAMSFDFISGYTGYLSFGHAAFFGIGAYFVVLGYNGQLPLLPAELPFMPLMLLGALAAAAVAFLVGLISFRLTGVYFAMITLGISEILFVISEHWNYLTPGNSDPTEGVPAGSPAAGVESFQPQIGVPFVDALQVETGIFGDDTLFGLDFEALGLLPFGEVNSAVVVSYFAIGAVVLVCYLTMQRIIHSPFGRVMIAIRENEQRAKAIGYNTLKYKMSAFMISAFFGGIAGGLLVAWQGVVDPDNTFFFLVTGFALIATIIGGIRTLAGPFFGYIFIESVEEFLSREGSGGGLQPYLEAILPGNVLKTDIAGLTVNEALDQFMTGHGEFYLGIIFVIFVLYIPIGILGTLRLRLGANSVAGSLSRKLRRSDETDEKSDTGTDGPEDGPTTDPATED